MEKGIAIIGTLSAFALAGHMLASRLYRTSEETGSASLDLFWPVMCAVSLLAFAISSVVWLAVEADFGGVWFAASGLLVAISAYALTVWLQRGSYEATAAMPAGAVAGKSG